MYPRIINPIRNHHSFKNINPKTFMLCHKGDNYNILHQLAFQGANVSLVEPLPKKNERSYSYTIAEEICERLKKPCITVLKCDIHNTKHIKYVMDETKNIYGKLDGIVLYDQYKWDYSCLMYSYMNFVKKGQIYIVEPENNIIQTDENFH